MKSVASRTLWLSLVSSVLSCVHAVQGSCFVTVLPQATGKESRGWNRIGSQTQAMHKIPETSFFRKTLPSRLSLLRSTPASRSVRTFSNLRMAPGDNLAWARGQSTRLLVPSERKSLWLASTVSRSVACSASSVDASGAPTKELPSRSLCVAPMMDWTDRFDRYFLRLFSKNTWLYTEMITTGALIHGDSHRHLRFDPAEHPIAVQLGGSEPADLAKCAQMCQEYGYDEINLNVGCPSERVSSGSFGACLMAEPELVGDCLAAMSEQVSLPVTIKHRIGIDDKDSYQHLYDFVDKVHARAPQTKTFIVHARTAILKGLSPKQNREIPPLKYDFVHRLKQDFPHLEILINGGINDLEHASSHLQHVDGVMIGRSAYNTPFQVLAEADQIMYGDERAPKTRQQVLEEMVPFIEGQLAEGASLNSMTRHMLGLFHGCKGGKAFRRYLSDHVHKPDSGIHTLLEAVEKVPLEVRLGLVPDNPKGPIEEHLHHSQRPDLAAPASS